MPKQIKNTEPKKKAAASSKKTIGISKTSTTKIGPRSFLSSRSAFAADSLHHQRTTISAVEVDFLQPATEIEPEFTPLLAWDLEELTAKEGDFAVEANKTPMEDLPWPSLTSKQLATITDRKVVLDKNGQTSEVNIQNHLDRSGHLLDLRPPEKIVRPKEPTPGKPIPVQTSSFLRWPDKVAFKFPKFQLKKKTLPAFIEKPPLLWLPSLERIRIVLTFIVFAFLLVMPVKGFVFYKKVNVIKDQLVNISQTAARDLQSGVQAATAADWEGALIKFQSAENSLTQAADYLQNTQANLRQVLFGLNPLESASYLITGATQLTKLAEQFTTSLAVWTAQQQSADQQLPWARKQLDDLLPQAQAANASLQQASTFGLPTKYQNQIKDLKIFLPYFINQLSQLKDLTTSLNDILGYNQERRYLLVFQNEGELRAGGGFLGSFAQVDLRNGQIAKMDIPGGGFYDLQGQATNYTMSPEPMRLVGKGGRWMAQDANWWPDFNANAQKIQWFYEKAGGPSTDGVIAINASLLPKLLNLVGPVTLPKFQVTLDEKNVIDELQKQVEFKYDKVENKPKQIIADAAPIILARLQNLPKEKYTSLLTTVLNGLKQKEVQLYFKNQDLEQKADAWQWTGRIASTTGDYTLAITQNIGGGKSDKYTAQTLEQYINFASDDSILKTVSINRFQQSAIPTDIFSFNQNNSFIRVYAPLSAELLKVTGQILPTPENFQKPASYLTSDPDLLRISGEITKDPISQTSINQEFGKKTFGNWLLTSPSENKTLSFVYHLPSGLIQWQTNRLKNWLNKLGWPQAKQGTYELLIQKQSGLNNQKIINHFSWPKNYEVTINKSPANALVESEVGQLTISYTQTQDEKIILNIVKK
ncbi:MAG: DUF4012 domain-containing protein [Candidatus Komeilibacteria bacterium]|nr:DUF4012 domain-containing protein [Candidatus Komeilibacteria bacterium]